MNIKQIAKAAGVSVATVSRVMNHPDSVAPATREKIKKVMDEAEYIPNWFARGLNFNSTKTIGLVIPHTINSNYMEIANGIEEVARQKGYITFICNMENDPKKEKEYIEQLVTRKVDGLILMFTNLDDECLEGIRNNRVPLVLICGREWADNWDSVSVDCRAGAAEMVAHLVSCGHETMGILCGDNPEGDMRNMLQGYLNVLRASGKKVDEDLIVHVENSIQGGYLGMKRLIVGAAGDNGINMQKLPDAVFATSDEIAYGAMDAIKDSGLRIPEEIAIAGFGNNRMSTLMEPKLTTVEQPFRKIGIYGARILFDQIDENTRNKKYGIAPNNADRQHIVLRSKMRVRKSCGNKGRIGEMF